MEYLKPLFDGQALTLEQLEEKLSGSKTIKLANLADGAYVGKEKYNTLENEVSGLKKQLEERDTQLDALKGVDEKGLQAEIDRLQGENKAAAEKHASELAALRMDAALNAAILGAKGKNAIAIKALLPVDKMSLQEDGSVAGLDLKTLQKSDPYLFEITETYREGNGNPGSRGIAPVDTSKMTYSETMDFLKNNPGAQI